jgi:hypothetical protein
MRTNRAREILKQTGLRVWQNKSLDQLTDQECEECLKEVERLTHTLYIR